jgi:8-oxo-dGTP pyrophosphatase MutT (NUDIX family)
LPEETEVITLTETEIARRLDASPHPDFPAADLDDIDMLGQLNGSARPAAVLVPLLQQDGEWHVLFTRRNADLPEHSGQVAFPGGRSDPEDQSPEQTALREAWEEIGLQPRDVHILGRLPAYLTITNFLVTPVVGSLPWPYPLAPKEAEVSRVFTIPLEWLAAPGNHELRKRQLPSPYPPVDVVYFKIYDGELLWGASARFTLALISALQLS